MRKGSFTLKTEPGARFGMWTTIEASQNVYVWWLCRCDCGTERRVRQYLLLNGGSTGCGCTKNVTHGMSKSAEYRIWHGMLNRCYRPKHIEYARYGGRGIRVCDEWRAPHGFPAFLAHVGPRPSPGHSIDRINVDGNYEPGNVRWASVTEQASNRRDSVKLTCRGEALTITEWARRLGMSESSLRGRLARGWSHERALTTPANKTFDRTKAAS